MKTTEYTAEPPVPHEPLICPGTELRLLLILSALMSFASVSTDMYLPALPTIGRDLHTNSSSIEATFSAFLIGFSLGQLLWGPISDRYARVKVYLLRRDDDFFCIGIKGDECS